MHRHCFVAPLAALALLLAVNAPASAAVFIVNSTLDVNEESPGNGSCDPVGAVGATCTLRAAIQEANALGGSHDVLVASGTYGLTREGIGEDAALTGDLDILAEIRIVNGTSNPPLVSAFGNDRVFDVRGGGMLTVENLHVHGGRADAPGNVHGGGFRVAAGGSLVLQDAIVSTNVGNIGGAIYSDGAVTISDSELFNNALVDDNVALGQAAGAAIFNRGQLVVERSTLRDNGVVPGGEGLVAAAYAIESSIGFVADPSVTITNSTIAENTNGVFSDGVETAIVHASIAANGARGLRFLRDLGNPGTVQLQVHRSVIVGHTGDCNGLVGTDAEYDLRNRSNASSDSTCGFSGGSDQQDIDWPFFGELAVQGGNTPVLMPIPGGPLVDAAGVLCLPFEDQRGTPRPLDGDLDFINACDIGAVEYDADSDPVHGTALFADGFEEL